MVLKTLDTLGSMHGYGIAQRIQQVSNDVLSLNQEDLRSPSPWLFQLMNALGKQELDPRAKVARYRDRICALPGAPRQDRQFQNAQGLRRTLRAGATFSRRSYARPVMRPTSFAQA
jgi:hypothetical protein